MSVNVVNGERLTPRQHAQKQDRFKFHRVIKVLREIELNQNNLKSLLDDEK